MVATRSGVVSADDLLAEVDAMIAERNIKDHELVTLMHEGKLSIEALRGVMVQFYFIGPHPNPRPQCAIYGICPPDPDIERYFFESVILEEATGSASGSGNHHELYLHFMEALGVSRELLARQKPIPEATAFVHWRFIKAYQGDWVGALCSIPFIEAASAERNRLMLAGLTNHYGFTHGSPALRFFELHASEVEEEHGTIAPVIVRKYATTEFLQNKVREVVETSLDLQWSWWDGMQRAYVDLEPRYERWRRLLTA